MHKSVLQLGTFFRFHITRTNSPLNKKPELDPEGHSVSASNFNFCGKLSIVGLCVYAYIAHETAI